MDQQKVGKFIAELRKERGLTQQELAKKIGVTDKAISKWENGRCLMDIAMLKPLSKSLGITEMELINGERIENNISNDKSSEFVEVTIKLANKKIKDYVKKIIIVIVVTCLLIGLISVIVYVKKFAYDYVYNYDNCMDPDNNRSYKELTFEKEIYVSTSKLEEDEYFLLDNLEGIGIWGTEFEGKNLKIKKELFDCGLKYNGDYDGWKCSEEFDGPSDAIFSVSPSLIYFFEQDSSGSAIIGDTSDYRYNFLEKNKIKSDHELLKYISKNLNVHDNNWLTNSFKEMKDDYIMMSFVYSFFPYYEVTNSEVITGAYDGYIITEEDDHKIINIYDEMFVYEIELYDEYTSDEFVQEFLSTLVIE